MDGFHSLWSKPYLAGKGVNEYWMQDYEVLTMVLSALMWRKKNGGIYLCADKDAISFIEANGLAPVWDLGIKEFTVAESVPSRVYWAAGKLYSLRQMKMPAVMVDLDLIIWQNLDELVAGTDICAIHREGLFPDIYPGKDFFNMTPDYAFDPEWSWETYPVNTCMLYLANEDFKNYYVDSAIDFMEHTAEREENLCHMVFAEQRMLAMCAGKMGQKVSTFFPSSKDIENQDIFTHLWGFKNILKFNYEERVKYNRKIYDRILAEAPELESVLAKLDVAL